MEGALKGAHRIPFFTWDRDDSPTSWHLENVVAVVSDCHELGQGWIPEDGIVRQANVHNVEVDELGAVVLALPEGDGAGGPALSVWWNRRSLLRKAW